MTNENVLRIRGKLQYFYEEQQKVHIKRFDKLFWNGIITSRMRDGVFIIQEEKLGECLLFAEDVYDVEEYKKPSMEGEK